MVSNQELDTPLNDFQQLMAITAEESGELTQVCMKLLRKYDSLDKAKNDKYIKQLIEEAGDVYCMIELMIEHGLMISEDIVNRAKVKRDKLRIWSTLMDDKE